MKSYPYIGKDNYGQIYLMLSSSDAITMDSDSFTHTPMEEGGYTNITHEYLQNTYGEVVSPEHAEFIVELGKNVKAEIGTEYRKGSFFNFYTGPNGELHLNFFDRHLAIDSGEKLITIPLPPKQIQTAATEEEFEMEHIMKNAGDNLVLGCEDSKCDEWPCVGGEVTLVSMGMTMYNKPVRLTYIGDGVGCYVDLTNGMEYTYAKRETVFKKPKTPEEELRDDIRGIIAESILGNKTNGEITKILIDKYNIKPQ